MAEDVENLLEIFKEIGISKPKSEDNLIPVPVTNKITNRGTGAGGSNTNKNGKEFEENTNIIPILVELGYEKKLIPKKENTKNGYYYTKTIDENKECIYIEQYGLKFFMNHFYKKRINRCPDGAMIFVNGDKKILSIIEKKAQNGEGSVDTKLYCGNGFKREYKYYLDDNWDIKYSFVLNDWLKKEFISDKKAILRKILEDDDIDVYFGNDSDFKDKIINWIKYPENWDF